MSPRSAIIQEQIKNTNNDHMDKPALRKIEIDPDTTSSSQKICFHCKLVEPEMCSKCRKSKSLRESRKIQRQLKEWVKEQSANEKLSWTTLRSYFYTVSKGKNFANDIWLIEFDKRNNFGIYDDYIKLKNNKKMAKLTRNNKTSNSSPYMLRKSRKLTHFSSDLLKTNSMDEKLNDSISNKSEENERNDSPYFSKYSYINHKNDKGLLNNHRLTSNPQEEPVYIITHSDHSIESVNDKDDNPSTHTFNNCKENVNLKTTINYNSKTSDQKQKLRELIESYRQSAQFLLLSASEIERIVYSQ